MNYDHGVRPTVLAGGLVGKTEFAVNINGDIDTLVIDRIIACLKLARQDYDTEPKHADDSLHYHMQVTKD